MTKIILLASAIAALQFPSIASAETIIALRDAGTPYLISFDSATPQTITGELKISGLPATPVKARPVAVDFRANGGLYLLVSNLPTANDCALYSLSTVSGFASAISPGTFACGPLGDPDIDPRSDLFRIVSGTSNYRYSLFTSTKTNGAAVAYASGDVNEGATPDIQAIAYDQNVASTSATTLFAIDAATDSLVRIGDVNGSVPTQDLSVATTLGSLGIPLTTAAFDISGASGKGYMFARDTSASPANQGLYTVELSGATAGTPTFVGKVGDGTATILSLTAVPATLFLPAPSESIDVKGGALSAATLGMLALLAFRRRRDG